MAWDWNNPTDKLGLSIREGFYYHHASQNIIYIKTYRGNNIVSCIGELSTGERQCLSGIVLQDCELIPQPCLKAKMMRIYADFIDKKLRELGLEWRLEEREKPLRERRG